MQGPIFLLFQRENMASLLRLGLIYPCHANHEEHYSLKRKPMKTEKHLEVLKEWGLGWTEIGQKELPLAPRRSTPLPQVQNPTWDQLCEVEPRLMRLWHLVSAVKGNGSLSELDFLWSKYYKPILVNLVGFNRGEDSVLGTIQAYDLAYEKIYNTLADSFENRA